MATVNSIQKKILEMSGGEFQKLCDAYLSQIGYGNPNSFGSVSGANIVKKGTPDSYFEHKNGKLIFAEYTVQKTGLYEKLNDDLDKCLDEEKTQVPIGKIQEIVMCYTGVLKPDELLKLKNKCEGNKIDFTSFSLSALANGLQSYPALLKDFLAISIDTGQIVPLKSFPSIYGTSKFATTLENNFLFREEELKEFANSIENLDLIIVTGQAGVGKSRFGLEGCESFLQSHPEYQGFAIVSKSYNLFEDLQQKLAQSGNFLIFVDDANRVMKFSYFMDFLRNPRENQKIKIVVTVRDYACSKIDTDVNLFPSHLISLSNFSDKEIKELASKEFGILNSLYLERIAKISNGNARIAVMASMLAREKNTLESIQDVSVLYDQYFTTIKEDLQSLGDKSLLKVAGIISLLRTVDKTNEEMMSGIEKAFSIPPNIFWNYVIQLDELEIVDLYENEIVRISDQVLSTYLFYLSCFKEKTIEFLSILKNYFPHNKERINDALIPTINSFNQNEILEIIKPKVEVLWETCKEEKSDENLLLAAQTFWYLLPAETLLLVREKLSQTEFKEANFSELNNLDDNKINNTNLRIELQILKNFYHAELDFAKIALQILFDYLRSRPSEILAILNVLIDGYGFDRHIHYRGVALQETIINSLITRSKNGANELFSRIFIVAGEEFLKTQHRSVEAGRGNTVNFYIFHLPATSEIKSLRDNILKFLFRLYEKIEYKSIVFETLKRYSNNYHEINQDELVANDATSITPFIKAHFTQNSFSDCVYVQNYLDFLESHEVTFDKSLRTQYQNSIFATYTLVSESQRNRRKYDNYEEYKQLRKENFIFHFSKISNTNIHNYIDDCISIQSEISNLYAPYEFTEGFNLSLIILADKYPGLFRNALEYYLEKGDQLQIHPHPHLHNFINTVGHTPAKKYILNLPANIRGKWLLGFYQEASEDKLLEADLLEIYNLFASSGTPPVHIDFLLKFTNIDSKALVKVVQIILEREDAKKFLWPLSLITNANTEINKNIEDIFRDDVPLLKKLYLKLRDWREHDDHDSTTLGKILDLDIEFITEYINWLHTARERGRHWAHDSQDYSALWKHKNYKEIFQKVVQISYEKEGFPRAFTGIAQFLKIRSNKDAENKILANQDEFLTELLKENAQDINFMEFLFAILANFSEGRRLKLISIFLDENKSNEDFAKLTLEPMAMSWSGSAVPVYQQRIDFFASLLPTLNNIELLEHRKYIEQRMKSLRQNQEKAKRQDFIND